MSQKAGERLIRRMYETFNSEGLERTIEQFCDERVEYQDDPEWPGGGSHHGREAVIARFREVAGVLGVEEAEVERVVDAGDALVWIVRFRGRSMGGGLPNDHAWGYFGRIANEQLVYFRAYLNPEDAFDAAGFEID